MPFFRKKPDPFRNEMLRLEEESRRVDEQLRDLESTLSAPQPQPKAKDPVFQGATFRGGDHDFRETSVQHRRLKIQKRRTRNRVITLILILLFLALLLWRTLF